MFGGPKLTPKNQNNLDHNRLIALINGMGDAFFRIDDSGIIELCNSMALNLLDSNGLEGKNLFSLLKPFDCHGREMDLQGSIIGKKANFSTRDWLIKNDSGKLVKLYINSSPVPTSYGNSSRGGYVIVLRDITIEKTKEDERDEFINVASHELRTPVTIAEGSISNAILLTQRQNLSVSLAQVLMTAHEQLVFLQSLINDLAMLSRADSQNLGAIFENVNLMELTQVIAHDYQPQAAKKGITLVAETEKGLEPVYGSKLHIREILQNLVSNAIKYTEKGGIRIKTQNSPEGVNISVIDTGIGIEQQEQAKLFTKFFRSEDNRVREIKGTGLGLYIAYKLASLLGASITVTSELNKGSSFTLHLPDSIYHPLEQKAAKTVA